MYIYEALAITYIDGLSRVVLAKAKPAKQWLNDETLVGETVYGTDAGRNLIGQPWKVYDQSGMIENARYDFKGNLLESKRRFAVEYKETINWNTNVTLETEEFVSRTEYDALNRAVSIKAPHNNANAVNEILPEYDVSAAYRFDLYYGDKTGWSDVGGTNRRFDKSSLYSIRCVKD